MQSASAPTSGARRDASLFNQRWRSVDASAREQIRMTDHLDLGPKPRSARRMPRWTLQLSFFMRGLAAAWFVKGVTWWLEIFGFDRSVNFEAKRAAAKAVKSTGASTTAPAGSASRVRAVRTNMGIVRSCR